MTVQYSKSTVFARDSQEINKWPGRQTGRRAARSTVQCSSVFISIRRAIRASQRVCVSQFAGHQVVVRSGRSCSARRRPSEIHVEARRSGPPAARRAPVSRVPFASKTPLARSRCAPRATGRRAAARRAGGRLSASDANRLASKPLSTTRHSTRHLSATRLESTRRRGHSSSAHVVHSRSLPLRPPPLTRCSLLPSVHHCIALDCARTLDVHCAVQCGAVARGASASTSRASRAQVRATSSRSSRRSRARSHTCNRRSALDATRRVNRYSNSNSNECSGTLH